MLLFALLIGCTAAARTTAADVVWDAPDPNPPGERWHALAEQPIATLTGPELLTVARFHVDRALWPAAADRDNRLMAARPYYLAASTNPDLTAPERERATYALQAINELLGRPARDERGIESAPDQPRTDPRADFREPPPGIQTPAPREAEGTVAEDVKAPEAPRASDYEDRHIEIRNRDQDVQRPAQTPAVAEWLWSQHDPTRQWETRPPGHPHHGVATALAVLALYDIDAHNPRLGQAADALAEMPVRGTFAVALRSLALGAAGAHPAQRRQDRDQLIRSLNPDGRLGPMALGPVDGATAIHTYAGITALDSAVAPDEPHGPLPWGRLAAFLVLQQQPDGGFPDPWKPGRLDHEPAAERFASDPTATVFSLATLQRVRGQAPPETAAAIDAAIRAGLTYLGQRFAPGVNPMSGRYHAAHDLALADLLRRTDRPTTSHRDMSNAITHRLAGAQQPDNSWGGVIETALAVLALHHAAAPPVDLDLVEVESPP